MVTGRRYGEVTARGTAVDGSLDQTFDAKWVTDASLSYRVLGMLHLTVGGNNLFDVYPQRGHRRELVRGILPYSGITPFGFNGAYWYVRAGVDLSAGGFYWPRLRSE